MNSLGEFMSKNQDLLGIKEGIKDSDPQRVVFLYYLRIFTPFVLRTLRATICKNLHCNGLCKSDK